MEHEILPCLSQPFGQVLERLLPPSCSACSGSVGSAPLGKGWFPQAAGEGMGMVRWEPGAQESRDLQESCAAAAVLCPGLQIKTPLSTVHRPPRAPQVRSPSGPTRSSARVGSSPSCPSSFHISRDAMAQNTLQPRDGVTQGLRGPGWGRYAPWAVSNPGTFASCKEIRTHLCSLVTLPAGEFPGQLVPVPKASLLLLTSLPLAAVCGPGKHQGKPRDSARKVRAAWLDLEGTWKEKSSAQNKTFLTHFQPGQVHCCQ